MLATMIITLCASLQGYQSVPVASSEASLATVAESSSFRATSTSADVASFGLRLARRSPLLRVEELGRTHEGRSIPLWIVADPPLGLDDAARARDSGKLIVTILANIHAGEVDGKEAVQALLRDLTSEAHPKLLENLILLVVPNYNADGNDAFARDNRPGQLGPENGMGRRSNGQGLDLNRDFVKLDAPETRALLRLFNRWDPHLLLDLHTTNGSYHRYTLTYQGPLNPAGDPAIVSFTRDTMLPAVGKAMKESHGWDTFFYGNFERDHSIWSSYPDWPRFGTNAFGLRNRIALLSESYSYALYKDRIQATRDFTHECLTYAAANRAAIARLLEEARLRATRAPQGSTAVIASEARAFPKRVAVLGYDEPPGRDRRKPPTVPKTYEVEHVQDFIATKTVARPHAYLIPARFKNIIENLQRHGIALKELREDLLLDVEVYRIESLERADRPYEGHVATRLEVASETSSRMVPAGTVIAETSQVLGPLLIHILEPESTDNLAGWGFLDSVLGVKQEFPVLRLPAAPRYPMSTGPIRSLAEDRGAPRRFDRAAAAALRSESFLARGSSGSTWLDDDHWLSMQPGGVFAVEARTGRARPWIDQAPLVKSLQTLPGIDEASARSIARSGITRLDATMSGFVFTRDDDLFHARIDGSKAVRLTNTKGEEELATISPDGRRVAFVRNNDLYVVDTATATERRLTEGGNDRKRNGKADWVYYEEIFNRNWKAHWWSPDSTHLGFLQIDDAPLRDHVVIDDASTPRKLEPTPYPRAGEPNPTVRFGLVSVVDQAPIRWLEVSRDAPEDVLVSKVSWMPSGADALVHVQDRIQTKLDLTRVPSDPKRAVEVVLRQTTKAWVEPPDGPFVLEDGTFLLTSERSGWKHLDLHSANGELLRALTSGNWEIRSVERFDAKRRAIWITATKDEPIAANLYRVSIDDGSITRLTHGPGNHSVKLNPGATAFLDTWSDTSTPPESALFDGEGKRIRTTSKASHHPLEDYRLGRRERVQIPARDGFILEGEVILPPDLDPNKLYPVWFMTYGGPHTPTISESWAGGRTSDHLLAADGIVVFRADLRSASGKGASSAWSAYKRLGIQELADIEDAIQHLCKRPYIDASRIGIAGHSYGGFMTAFAMTHSKLFSCGIAGAPVTDWRDYDSIYTERFMQTPALNPKGYSETSVVEAAARLHGRLLIAHGMMDDNVSVRNTLRLVHALQQADRDFELMIYPTARHGIPSRHYSRLQEEFIRRNLGGPRDRPR
ncbi:MAG: DPP IV N-terminal domain-containing protein [Isosphaeraceae bacterium]|nr:DPP IV N-terminal domain-containing protein [Isosphaeraceae bacterium]